MPSSVNQTRFYISTLDWLWLFLALNVVLKTVSSKNLYHKSRISKQHKQPHKKLKWLPCPISSEKKKFSIDEVDYTNRRLFTPGVCSFRWILAVFHRAGFNTSIVMLWEKQSRHTRICTQINKTSTRLPLGRLPLSFSFHSLDFFPELTILTAKC